MKASYTDAPGAAASRETSYTPGIGRRLIQDTFRQRPALMQYRDGAGHGEDRRDVTFGKNDDPANPACEPVSRRDRPQRATGTAVLFFKQKLRFANELVDRAPNIGTGEIP